MQIYIFHLKKNLIFACFEIIQFLFEISFYTVLLIVIQMNHPVFQDVKGCFCSTSPSYPKFLHDAQFDICSYLRRAVVCYSLVSFTIVNGKSDIPLYNKESYVPSSSHD